MRKHLAWGRRRGGRVLGPVSVDIEAVLSVGAMIGVWLAHAGHLPAGVGQASQDGPHASLQLGFGAGDADLHA